ncbi:predicted protein [Sclerotinia sclerotiorum 1980 UF-70]|uniref:Uncharacterized protein n=1 Tax=Sclerotinia sclerotiorum (strain ATCC 18683 / 1980 / Ss-1) TaxID=665079 RepID=A7EZZ8_SCLS1|nr:predicted protein [Sclerotinia sclerotiorum 1980 UF-70]EDN95040.1 predicted protein [Sclerotinia sclerotiorum 1980 UF-70]
MACRSACLSLSSFPIILCANYWGIRKSTASISPPPSPPPLRNQIHNITLYTYKININFDFLTSRVLERTRTHARTHRTARINRKFPRSAPKVTLTYIDYLCKYFLFARYCSGLSSYMIDIDIWHLYRYMYVYLEWG